jgi:hypothetical protein
MRHRRLRIALSLLGATFMTASCGGPSEAARPEPTGLTGGWSTAGCEFARVPVTTTMGGHIMPATPPKLGAAIARIEAGGRGRYSRSYAGIEVDQVQVRAVVYRVPSSAFDKFVRNSAEDTCVVVRDALHGLAELTTWHDRVVAELPMWDKRGIRISSVGARHDGAGVEIGTPDVATARRELMARYGARAPLLFVKQGTVVPLRPPSSSAPATRPQAPPSSPS